MSPAREPAGDPAGAPVTLTERAHALLGVRADLTMVRALVTATSSLHNADPSAWQALGYVLDGVLHAIDADLFLLAPQRWTPPPAHVLELLCELTAVQYQDALRAGALPLLVVAPWDRARTVMTALRTANGALDVDQFTA